MSSFVAAAAGATGAAFATDEAQAAPGDDPRPIAGGRLMWDFDDDLDLLGDIWAELPFRVAPGHALFLNVETRTEIEKSTRDVTFLLRDLEYALDVGWRTDRAWTASPSLIVLAGQRGKEGVDRAGQPYVRYVAAGLESTNYRRTTSGPAWRFVTGPVIEEREVQADWMLRGDASWRIGRRDRRPDALFELHVDGLIDGSSWRGDLRGGPGIVLPAGPDHETTLFLHYQASRNPLGIGHSTLLAGFSLADAPGGGREQPGKAPAVSGAIGLGVGDDGRLAGQLRLDITSPAFGPELRAAFDVDANILTAEETGDLYYLYSLGLDRAFGDALVGGAYFYHRSNHVLAEDGPGVTSINVLELGVETPGWTLAGGCALCDACNRIGVEGYVRGGWLLDSSFGEERRWHLRAGARVHISGAFLSVELETGDVERQQYALGFAVRENWDLQFEFRNDSQYFAADRNVFLLNSRYGF